MPPSPSAAQPASVSVRSLAPDLARGLMLLLIALAHAPAFVSDWRRGPLPLDAAAEFLKSLVAENQARNMFVFLFGYGLVQLTRRQEERGADWPAIRGLLRRRGLWLVVIGFAHTVLLVPLDIVAVYGLTLLVLTSLVRARDAVLWRTALATLVPATLLLAWQSVTAWTAAAAGSPVTMARFMEPDVLTHLVASIPSWPVETAVGTITVVPGMALGVWAARRRVLEEPERHEALLRRAAVLLIGVSLAGRLPAALLAAGAWSTTSAPALWAVAVAHDLTGYAGGIGLAAAVGLVALRAGRRRGRLTEALAALGQRSLTFYLFQSVVWLALFYPFTLDLRDDMGAAGSFAVGAGSWALSVVLAEWMRRGGHRGPAEVLLRRLSYGRAPR
ncbi:MULTISPECIES: DUF418 domain-containing protein [unclassified Nonomuraea]|uniref:DUF418 domain-containing protein n=1 Tax=unclassified Nonomuraea TaxID=2593643 RepID=UPI00340C3581